MCYLCLVLSCNCTLLSHEGTSTPVQQDACALPQSFKQKEEVMLCPTILLVLCQNFNGQHEVDLFASHHQHQLPRYYSVDPNDQYAEGYNEFNFRWTPEITVYVYPPWYLLDEVVDKIIQDGTRVLLATHRWPEERRERRYWRKPLYLDDSGRLQRAPAWATVFIFIQGTPTYHVQH